VDATTAGSYKERVKVLVVEDEKNIASFVRKGLQEAGFTVTVCRNGDEAYSLARSGGFDVLVLDIMLPGRDGLSILRNLREAKNTVPVILVTARSALNERLEGLNLGADDYLAKPFYVEELIARIHAVTRRALGDQLTQMSAGDLTVNLITREVKRGAMRIELTAREFSLLELLMRSPGRVYTRTQILEHVWGYDFDPQTNVVDVCIRRLRNKIDLPDDKEPLIETVRNVGYRFRQMERK
jgi:two-component system, OmpR family, response regulator